MGDLEKSKKCKITKIVCQELGLELVKLRVLVK